MATAKKKRATTARKRPSKPRRRATPAAAAAPADAAPQRRLLEHPLVSPVLWTVIAGALAIVWTQGEGLYRDFRDHFFWTPAPFTGESLGILLARLDNDPSNEYSSRVRSALEHQFPVGADGNASVKVNLYPETLALPEYGDLYKNIANANAEGREWLKEQRADLLIWGKALPQDKELELRIITPEPQVELGTELPKTYSVRIPTEFSDQIAAALAGMVAGAGANAWNQRGGYLSPARAQELAGWLTRLSNLRGELPATLGNRTRTEIEARIDTAIAQIGSALAADGSSEIAYQAMSIVFAPRGTESDGGILTSEPLLTAELLADIVSQFTDISGQVSPEQAAPILAQAQMVSESFAQRHEEGKLNDTEYAYLSGLMLSLKGRLEILVGDFDAARDDLSQAESKLEDVLAKVPAEQDALSNARIQGHLGTTQLALALLADADNAPALLDASIASLKGALKNVSSETAPRDAVRLNRRLAAAELNRMTWFLDVEALERSIGYYSDALPLLVANQRRVVQSRTARDLSALLTLDALYSAGLPSARKSLDLLDELKGQVRGQDLVTDPCASLEGDQRGHCIDQRKMMALEDAAALEQSFCLAHFAAGYRFDEDMETLSKGAREHLTKGLDACETSATGMRELDNLGGWVETSLFTADTLNLLGDRTKDPAPLKEAIALMEDVQSKIEGIDAPAVQGQVALAKASAMRDLGYLKGDPGLIQDAKKIQLSVRSTYSGKDYTLQRNYADGQIALSLIDLAELEKTDEGLDEAITLLRGLLDRYAKGGAKLAAADAARELKKARELQAKLAAN
ncbi:MAG: hypothetical protein QNJ62_00785 [Methyloceanibacter sp.]|nr:hypothetical protein [Methyloceanibacter sp.]